MVHPWQLHCFQHLLVVFMVFGPAESLVSSKPSVVRAVYAGHPDRYAEYRVCLEQEFQEANIDVTLDDKLEENPDTVDYIIYSPNGPLRDFSPFNNAKAVLNLWAGVEGIVDNPTLPESIPLCRMVDPGLREGMVEYVTGHVLRYHLSMDRFWKQKAAREWIQSESGESMLPLARHRTVGILGFRGTRWVLCRSLAAVKFSCLWMVTITKAARRGALL